MQHGTAGGVPDYATGEAHTLAPVLAARPQMRIAVKSGFLTAATGADA
ncbi:hypothetical protein ACIQVL_20200 [Streptomyces sp. NPDC090499]